MKLNKKLALASAFVLSTGTAFANLGDTLSASIQKYGNPLSSKSPVVNFHNGDCFISEIFNARGRCVFIKYVRQRNFSEEELKNIISFNIDQGEAVTELQTHGVSRQWQSKNVLASERILTLNLGYGSGNVAFDSISIGEKEGWQTAYDLR